MDRSANLSTNTGGLVESHKGYDPRLVSFYFMVAALLLTLAGSLAYQQLFNTFAHEERERKQNQRRVLVPGPRGNIYARDGTVLVGNRPRFSVVLYLDELRGEIRREYLQSRKAYRASGDKDLPTDSQLWQIARVTVAQRYLDDINKILKRDARVDVTALKEHFARQQLLLPYTLLDELSSDDYARLLEGLPVRSPVQVYTSSTRYYPFGSAAAHALGYIGTDPDIAAEDFPGDDLRTFKMKGTIGRNGLEKQFDAQLQGEAGGSIFRVDPSGYKVNPPLDKRTPVQGKNLVTSLDIDLQLAAEEAIGDQTGAAVALDVHTGEVLVLASKPDYNLADLSPRFSQATRNDIEARGAWINRALYPHEPGSTFKIVTSIAALRSGAVTPDDVIADCRGTMLIGNTPKTCDNGHGHHGPVKLSEAIAVSCDIYYYNLGQRTTPETIAAEGKRFHLDQRTGIELPFELKTMVIPDPEWKKRTQNEKWFPGDTANMAIGQGFVLVSPLEMACFAASVARDEVFTKPTLVHNPNAKTQHTESIGLTPVQRAALVAGMVDCTRPTYAASTAYLLNSPTYKIPGVQIAGKTGTAQKKIRIGDKLGYINYAWFICFAPAEKPEVAVAVMLEGDTIGESFGGGTNAGPIAATILKKYFEKKNRPATTAIKALQTP